MAKARVPRVDVSVGSAAVIPPRTGRATRQVLIQKLLNRGSKAVGTGAEAGAGLLSLLKGPMGWGLMAGLIGLPMLMDYWKSSQEFDLEKEQLKAGREANALLVDQEQRRENQVTTERTSDRVRESQLVDRMSRQREDEMLLGLLNNVIGQKMQSGQMQAMSSGGTGDMDRLAGMAPPGRMSAFGF